MSDSARAKLVRFWAVPRVRQSVQSLALALLMAGIATLSIKVFGWQAWWRRARASVTFQHHAPKPGSFDLSHDQALVRVPPEPEPSEPPPKSSASGSEHRYQSPSELFAAAASARSRGDIAEAIRISKEIEQFFPSSEEGINTHLTLGVLYVQEHESNLALQEFGLFRQVGSPEAKAEALWGQAQALQQLQRADDERGVLEELLRSYPRSIYVAASRTRLSELGPDAGAR